MNTRRLCSCISLSIPAAHAISIVLDILVATPKFLHVNAMSDFTIRFAVTSLASVFALWLADAEVEHRVEFVL